MKTLFRVLALGMFLSMLGAVSAFAQEPDLAALFEKFKTERKQPCGSREAALATGKQILEKFANDPDNQEVIKYVKDQVAIIEKDDPGCKRNLKYDSTYKAKDWTNFTAVSKEIISAEPGNSPLGLDVMLTLVSVGYDRVRLDNNDAYINDTLSYAKQAIQRIDAGTASSTGNWGVFLPFKTKEFADGKANAQNGLNYIIGWINYDKLGKTDASKKKEALGYFYKSTQYKGEFSNDFTIYTRIGDYYFAEAARLDKEYRDIRAANNNTETDEAKAKLALARGFADRGIDAFGRGKQVAITAKAPKAAETIGKTLSDLYKFRFNLAPTAPTPDLDKYVSGLTAKPMPDPSTEPTPVVEEVAPTTTGTTTPSTTTTTPAATTNSTTKTPASTTTTPAATTTKTTTTKTTTPAKKPVAKKKGTR